MIELDATDFDLELDADEFAELDLDLGADEFAAQLSEVDLDAMVDESFLAVLDEELGGIASTEGLDEVGEPHEVDAFLSDETFDRTELAGGDSVYAGGDGETSYVYDSDSGASVIPGEGVVY